MIQVLYISLMIGFISWVTFRWIYRKTFRNIKNLTELENFPLIGSAHLFYGLTAEEIYNIFVTKASSLVSPIKLWIFSKLIIVLDDPDDIQKILTSPQCLEKGSVYDHFRNEYGLVSSKPHIWKPSRKFLNSTFSLQMIRSFMTIFNENSQDLVKDLAPKCGQNEFDIFEVIGKRSVDLQMRTAFGVKLEPSHITTLYNNMKKLLFIYAERFIKIHSQIIYMLFKHTKKYQEDILLQTENGDIYSPITEQTKIEYLKELQDDTSMETDDEFSKKPEILIKRLVQLEHKGYIKPEQVKDHIETMLLAGGDTLAISLSTVVLCLAMYPEVQEKVVDELREIITSKDDAINFDTVANLKYLDMVCKEALRLIPTIPLILRKPSTDIELPSCTIPTGTDIFILIINLHRRKDIWGPNAESFNPDNFLPENIANRHKLAYIPFSYGSRNCIAMKYATLSLRIIMAKLLMNYKFSTHLKMNDLKLGFGITIHIINKHMVKIENRIFK